MARREERTRLAREIHDTLLQGVTGISLNLQAVLPEVRTSPTTALPTLERIAELAVRTACEARLAVWDLRPQPLTQRELAKAVESVARLALGESSLTLQVSTTERARRVPADAQGAVLRVVQEAVSNVVRHAAARRVRIRLAFRGAWLRVKVADDGKGFSQRPPSQVGLRNVSQSTAVLTRSHVCAVLPERVFSMELSAYLCTAVRSSHPR